MPLRGRASLYVPRPQSYACVAEALVFSREGVAVRFCARGDGSLGPLQDASTSTLLASSHSPQPAAGRVRAAAFAAQRFEPDADAAAGGAGGGGHDVAGHTFAEAQQAGRAMVAGACFYPLASLLLAGATDNYNSASPCGLSLHFAFGAPFGGYSQVELVTLTRDLARRARLDHFAWVARATGCDE